MSNNLNDVARETLNAFLDDATWIDAEGRRGSEVTRLGVKSAVRMLAELHDVRRLAGSFEIRDRYVVHSSDAAKFCFAALEGKDHRSRTVYLFYSDVAAFEMKCPPRDR